MATVTCLLAKSRVCGYTDFDPGLVFRVVMQVRQFPAWGFGFVVYCRAGEGKATCM